MHPTQQQSSLRVSIIGKKSGILSWQADLAEALVELGAQVQFHNIQCSSISERIEQICLKRRQLENEATCKRISKELTHFNPDLVLVLNKAGLTHSANDRWRAAVTDGTPIVGWICDRITALPPSQNPNFDGVYYFDSSSKVPLELAYEATTASIQYLPLAASQKRFPYVPTPLEAIKPSLVFVGHCSASRKEEIEAYRALGGSIEVYGPKSDGLTSASNNRRFNHSEQAQLYRTHLACFNPLQIANTLHGLNLRAFEVPLSGGLGCYSSHAKDLPTCFDLDSEVLSYQSLEDLKEKVDQLQKEPERLQQMREAGRQRVLNAHTFTHRAEKILADWLPNL
jgi:hypothetical protein